MSSSTVVKVYPRSSGYAGKHMVPSKVCTFKDVNAPTSNELIQGLLYLKSIRADLRPGDVVIFKGNAGWRNEGVTLYTGEHLIDVNRSIDATGMLPRCFRVILNGVPLDYWHSQNEDFGYIEYNYTVWYNHHAHIDQCLDGIRYGQVIPGMFGIFTTFVYKDLEYMIVYEYCESINPRYIGPHLQLNQRTMFECATMFRRRLQSDHWLQFCCVSAGTYPYRPRTLYLPAPELSRLGAAL